MKGYWKNEDDEIWPGWSDDYNDDIEKRNSFVFLTEMEYEEFRDSYEEKEDEEKEDVCSYCGKPRWMHA